MLCCRRLPHLSISGFTILSQSDLTIVLLAADMFPAAKPIILLQKQQHQPEDFEGGEQEKRATGAVSVIHLSQ